MFQKYLTHFKHENGIVEPQFSIKLVPVHFNSSQSLYSILQMLNVSSFFLFLLHFDALLEFFIQDIPEIPDLISQTKNLKIYQNLIG